METICTPVRKVFKGIDITKFLLAILVVAGHTHPFKDIQNPTFIQLWKTVLLLVVPYFFMAAGFCLFSKVFNQPDRTSQLAAIWRYLKRILKLYLYWTIIFLPITLWHYAHDYIIFHKDMILFVRGVFFFGENYYSWPLWYLLSMIYSIAFIYFLMLIKLRIKTIFLISIIIFIMAIIFNYLVQGESKNTYLLAIGKAVKYLFLSGRLFTGMFYIIVGGLITIKKIQLSNAIMVIFVSVAIIFQFYKIEFISPLLFSLLPITLFYLTINLKLEDLKDNVFLRKCSTVLYFTHMIVFFLCTLIYQDFKYFGWDVFLISVMVPIAITPLIIKNEERFPILKQLFG